MDLFSMTVDQYLLILCLEHVSIHVADRSSEQRSAQTVRCWEEMGVHIRSSGATRA